MDNKQTDDLLNFLNASPTAWHAVNNIADALLKQGFTKILESEKWLLQPGGRYFVDRHGSTLAAFVMPHAVPSSAIIIGTHSDSPALKLKPNAEYQNANMIMMGTEVYGAPLLNSWLNRELGIAGKISFLNTDNAFEMALVNIRNAPLVIPQLAIHLDRNVNEQGLILNKQEHLSAIACLVDESLDLNNKGYLTSLLMQQVAFKTLLAHDLLLYPLEGASYIGNNKEMLAGYRLDNLCSVHAGLQALLESMRPAKEHIKLFVCWDNEEIGSQSANGASSPFLPHLLERIMLAVEAPREAYLRLLSQSTHISVDLGHASHPNYMAKHEPNHRPLLNCGIVLKINAQQRYASSAMTSGKIVAISKENNIPLQQFVVRSDMPCGSTIGPITAALTGIATVDIGIPQLSMHAAREIIGTKDYQSLVFLLQKAIA